MHFAALADDRAAGNSAVNATPFRRHNDKAMFNKTTVSFLLAGILLGYALSDRIAQVPVVNKIPKL